MSKNDFPTCDPDYTSSEGVKCWFRGLTTYQEFPAPDGRRFKRVQTPREKKIYVTDLQTGFTTIDEEE
jgi:hypothetical protein